MFGPHLLNRLAPNPPRPRASRPRLNFKLLQLPICLLQISTCALPHPVKPLNSLSPVQVGFCFEAGPGERTDLPQVESISPAGDRATDSKPGAAELFLPESQTSSCCKVSQADPRQREAAAAVLPPSSSLDLILPKSFPELFIPFCMNAPTLLPRDHAPTGDEKPPK
ncbi:unnamed protein product [Pleuronectes platessa]|uniref:Uncharacterized protein n=1 Tax=Pleuronectes platessa TaxID=8262 RepID=A0A9N7UW65_PLEPL|nr:unnamed protein product [Pleuronectes platessa]